MRQPLILITLILVACGEKQLTEADFRSALDQSFLHAGPVCVTLDKGFPASLNQMEQEYGVGRAYKALEDVGLLSSVSDGKGRHYKVTDAGRKFYSEQDGQSIGLSPQKVKQGAMCFADMRVGKVVRWYAQSDHSFAVSYTYRLENLAPWAIEPRIIQTIPRLAAWINGIQKTERNALITRDESVLNVAASGR